MGTSAKDDRWAVLNPRDLVAWAFDLSTDHQVAVTVLEWVLGTVLEDPDRGEHLSTLARQEQAPGTDVMVTWTIDRRLHAVDFLTPPPIAP